MIVLTVFLFAIVAMMTGWLVILTVQLKKDLSQAISGWQGEETTGKLATVAGDIANLLNELCKRPGNPVRDQAGGSPGDEARAFEEMFERIEQRLERLETRLNETSRALMESRKVDLSEGRPQPETRMPVRRDTTTMIMGADERPSSVRKEADEWSAVDNETRSWREQVNQLVRQGYPPNDPKLQGIIGMLKEKGLEPIIPEKGYPYRRNDEIVPVDVEVPSGGVPGQIVGIVRVGWRLRGRVVVRAEVEVARPKEDV